MSEGKGYSLVDGSMANLPASWEPSEVKAVTKLAEMICSLVMNAAPPKVGVHAAVTATLTLIINSIDDPQARVAFAEICGKALVDGVIHANQEEEAKALAARTDLPAA